MKSLPELRRDALAIFQSGLRAVDAAEAIKRHVSYSGAHLKVGDRSYDLSSFESVYAVGAGKAAARMAEAVEDLLGPRLAGGMVSVKYGHTVPLKVVRVHEAGHPIPDDAGAEATAELIRLLRKTGERDLVLCLLSGGGSALWVSPAEGITLRDKRETTRVLLECGTRIRELNAIRKHISQIKGGRLARLAFPSTLITLILSDVVGDDLESIASGPTVPDTSRFSDCLRILDRFGIAQRIPVAVRRHLELGAKGKREETPKAHDLAFLRTQNVIVGSNLQCIEAAGKKAEELGYHNLILSRFIEGEAREVANAHAAVAREIHTNGHHVKAPACVISGGETTVTVRGRGRGGRNQEFVLAAAIALDGLKEVVVLSGGTDGTDGLTDAAGAVADGETVRRAKAVGLEAEDYLRENDSYQFFDGLGDLLKTGPTLTNVMDLRIVLVG